MFRPLTVQINCPSDFNNFANSLPSSLKLAKAFSITRTFFYQSRSEQFWKQNVISSFTTFITIWKKSNQTKKFWSNGEQNKEEGKDRKPKQNIKKCGCCYVRIKKKKTIIRFKTAVVTARSLACLIDNFQDLNFRLRIQKPIFNFGHWSKMDFNLFS